MPIWSDPPTWFGGQNWSGSFISTITTTDTTTYPAYGYPQPPLVITPVLESPSAELGDREWLDAQVAEVCELAAAA